MSNSQELNWTSIDTGSRKLQLQQQQSAVINQTPCDSVIDLYRKDPNKWTDAERNTMIAALHGILDAKFPGSLKRLQGYKNDYLHALYRTYCPEVPKLAPSPKPSPPPKPPAVINQTPCDSVKDMYHSDPNKWTDDERNTMIAALHGILDAKFPGSLERLQGYKNDYLLALLHTYCPKLPPKVTPVPLEPENSVIIPEVKPPVAPPAHNQQPNPVCGDDNCEDDNCESCDSVAPPSVPSVPAPTPTPPLVPIPITQQSGCQGNVSNFDNLRVLIFGIIFGVGITKISTI
jgi:hypothetical protein